MPRSASNYRAVTKAVEAVVKEGRHDSLSKKVKHYLKHCGKWSYKMEDKFPVVAEVKGLDQVEVEMRAKLLGGLKKALGIVEKTRSAVVGVKP